jgi:hypothetical protein
MHVRVIEQAHEFNGEPVVASTTELRMPTINYGSAIYKKLNFCCTNSGQKMGQTLAMVVW